MLGGILRSKVAQNLLGQMSMVFKMLLKQFFGPVLNFEIGGARIDLGSRVVLLVARLAVTLADASALKQLLESKGSGGTKPCPGCKNVLSALNNPDGVYLVGLNCFEVQKFDM